MQLIKFIILVNFISFLSCTNDKNNCQNPQPDKHIPVVFNSLKFKIGSWWIYKNLKNEYDSVYVTNASSGIYYFPLGTQGFCRVTHDFYQIDIHSSYFNNSKYIYYIDDEGFTIKFNNNWVAPSIPTDIDESWKYMYHNIDTLKTFSGLFVNVVYSKQYTSAFQDSICYYANFEVGLIKKEILIKGITDTWEIVRWHIEK